ncbi:MAG: hypothetical protein OXD32_00990, partial [Endozoicomonadaceae bacterium]|nr:hypothetical protein [Endozoicomonadaceae bacterium]
FVFQKVTGETISKILLIRDLSAPEVMRTSNAALFLDKLNRLSSLSEQKKLVKLLDNQSAFCCMQKAFNNN